MLLDADSLPLRNPTELFDSEPFVTHGNLFWPDFWKKMWIKEDFYKKLVQEVPWEVDETFSSAESGQVGRDGLACISAITCCHHRMHALDFLGQRVSSVAQIRALSPLRQSGMLTLHHTRVAA